MPNKTKSFSHSGILLRISNIASFLKGSDICKVIHINKQMQKKVRYLSTQSGRKFQVFQGILELSPTREVVIKYKQLDNSQQKKQCIRKYHGMPNLEFEGEKNLQTKQRDISAAVAAKDWIHLGKGELWDELLGPIWNSSDDSPSISSWLKFGTNTGEMECHWNIQQPRETEMPQHVVFLFKIQDKFRDLVRKIFMEPILWKPVQEWKEYTIQLENDTCFSRMNFSDGRFYCKYSCSEKPSSKWIPLPSTEIFGLSSLKGADNVRLFEEMKDWKDRNMLASPEEALKNVEQESQEHLADLHFKLMTTIPKDCRPNGFTFYHYNQCDKTEEQRMKAHADWLEESAHIWRGSVFSQEDQKQREEARKELTVNQESIDWSKYF